MGNRELLAQTVERSALTYREDARLAVERGDVDLEMWATLRGNELAVAAAALRESCAGCRHWAANHVNPDWRKSRICFAKGMYRGYQPEDGSGFCHRWDAK